jgi:plastocyanin
MTTASRLLLVLPLLACGAESGPSGGADEPVVAMAKLAPSGDGQTGGIGTTLPLPLRVRITEDGVPLAGRVVTFAPGAGAGTLIPATDTTDGDGIASAEWHLANSSGTRSVTVGSIGVTGSPQLFQATVLPGAAADLSVVSGAGQVQEAGLLYAQPLIVRVSDAFNNPVPGVTVQWTVIVGSGAPQTPTSLTQSDGRAALSLEAGDSVGDLVIRATTASIPADTVAFALDVIPAATVISVASNLFSPQHITIPSGGTVRWTWVSGTHNVALLNGPGSFPDSPLLMTPNSHGPFILTAVGVYNYECAVHEGMVGSITVQAAGPTRFGGR